MPCVITSCHSPTAATRGPGDRPRPHGGHTGPGDRPRPHGGHTGPGGPATPPRRPHGARGTGHVSTKAQAWNQNLSNDEKNHYPSNGEWEGCNNADSTNTSQVRIPSWKWFWKKKKVNNVFKLSLYASVDKTMRLKNIWHTILVLVGSGFHPDLHSFCTIKRL